MTLRNIKKRVVENSMLCRGQLLFLPLSRYTIATYTGRTSGRHDVSHQRFGTVAVIAVNDFYSFQGDMNIFYS